MIARSERMRAALTLVRHRMPRAEIRAVLAAGEPRVVRGYLELHRERLEEELVQRRRALAFVERALTDALEDEARIPA